MKVLRSLLHSFAQALRQNEYVAGFVARHQKFFAFLNRRFSRNEPYGAPFTVWVALSAAGLLFFLGLAEDVLSRDPFVAADVRIMNLVAALRSMPTARVMLFFTYLGNWQIIVSSGAAVLVLLLLSQRRRMALFLTGAVAGGELLYAVMKMLFHRTRPDLGFSLITRNGYAFPSGHAVMSVVFYGILGFFLWKIAARGWHKALILIGTAALIFLIGLSRVYLGAHWPSDVLAGWAVGLAFLALFLAFFVDLEVFHPESSRRLVLGAAPTAVLGTALLLFEVAFIYAFFLRNPLVVPAPQDPTIIAIASSPEELEKTVSREDFPKFSETLVGQKMEPISLVVVGSRDTLVEAFRSAGWSVADKPRPATLSRLAVAAVLNLPYDAAPVTPAFLDAQPDTLAFEKATAAETVRERHHARFWGTKFRYGDVPVWVGTASFDKGLRFLITHKIAPNIDTEREFVYADLGQSFRAGESRTVQLVEPMLGENQIGDAFFTDGKAYILLLN